MAVSVGSPFPELPVIDSRRLLMIALLTIAPLAAACHAPTGVDGDGSTPVPADTTTRKDVKPWG